MLTQERLKYLLNYNPRTGEFTRIKKLGRFDIGSLAGTINQDGYRRIKIDKKMYRSSRLVWLYMIGEMPKSYELIDHINDIRNDDRWNNLQIVNSSQNAIKKKTPITNSSGHRGVCRKNNKWYAQIWVDGKCKYLGYYEDIQEAAKAYNIASLKYHGKFSVLNAAQ